MFKNNSPLVKRSFGLKKPIYVSKVPRISMKNYLDFIFRKAHAIQRKERKVQVAIVTIWKEIDLWKRDLRNSGSVQMSEAGWPGVKPGTRPICQK